MIFQETKLKGAFIVELDKHEDERGFFARAFCAREFEEHGLCTQMVQANLSFSQKKGTLRGLHYQVPPASEPKFIRCISGAVWDVIVDMRPESPTYLEHIGVELSAENRRAIYVPDMFAHGNQALTDNAELLYLMGEYFTPGCARGLRYDDPALGIQWPQPVSVILEKDLAWPLLDRGV
ncbi:MAG: dTDP-4-dehydrorhamnose 3,5-epimerase [Luteolibacter sp.]